MSAAVNIKHIYAYIFKTLSKYLILFPLHEVKICKEINELNRSLYVYKYKYTDTYMISIFLFSYHVYTTISRGASNLENLESRPRGAGSTAWGRIAQGGISWPKVVRIRLI